MAGGSPYEAADGGDASSPVGAVQRGKDAEVVNTKLIVKGDSESKRGCLKRWAGVVTSEEIVKANLVGCHASFDLVRELESHHKGSAVVEVPIQGALRGPASTGGDSGGGYSFQKKSERATVPTAV